MADYRALIANCLIGGESFSTIDGHQIRNVIRTHLGQFDVEIIQHPEYIIHGTGDYRGQSLHTTNLYIRNLPAQDFAAAELLIRDFAELLSFATVSDVACFGYDFPDVQPVSQRRDVIGETQRFRPLFDTRNGSLVRHFLEATLPTYRQLRDVRQLNIAIAYYVLSGKSGLPIELQLVTVFVLLEHLKHTFGHQQGYPFIKGYFRHHGATAAHPGPKLTFEQLLTAMFAAVGMAPNLRAAITLRNELIHSGMSQLDFAAKWTMFCTLQDYLREYFLRLCNYHGEYSAFSNFATITL
jgi:hypothetical protein